MRFLAISALLFTISSCAAVGYRAEKEKKDLPIWSHLLPPSAVMKKLEEVITYSAEERDFSARLIWIVNDFNGYMKNTGWSLEFVDDMDLDKYFHFRCKGECGYLLLERYDLGVWGITVNPDNNTLNYWQAELK